MHSGGSSLLVLSHQGSGDEKTDIKHNSGAKGGLFKKKYIKSSINNHAEVSKGILFFSKRLQ